MNIQIKKWGTLILLSIIWGSSYILIKKGLGGLTAIELGSIRIMITTIIVAPFGYSKIKSIPKEKFKWVLFSACVGSFFPAYLFAFAETQISSSVTAVMVSLTPLFTLLISVIIFSAAFIRRQLLGVFVGFIGILRATTALCGTGSRVDLDWLGVVWRWIWKGLQIVLIKWRWK